MDSVEEREHQLGRVAGRFSTEDDEGSLVFKGESETEDSFLRCELMANEEC